MLILHNMHIMSFLRMRSNKLSESYLRPPFFSCRRSSVAAGECLHAWRRAPARYHLAAYRAEQRAGGVRARRALVGLVKHDDEYHLRLGGWEHPGDAQ